MSEEQQPCKFKDPDTLKDILELLEKLMDARSISSPVLGKLEEEAKKYFKESDILSPLATVFTRASGIRSTILESPSYDKYSSLTGHEGHDCVPRALKTCLPKAYAALLFMLFNCDTAFSGYSLGEWSGQKVNGIGSSHDLYQWLTDDRLVTPGLIKRGFLDRDLDDSNDGQTVAPVIKQIISHDSAGPLQKVLLYLLFVCPWDPSLTGHALCFLSMFCVTVQSPQKNFEGYSEELKNVCQEIQSSLNSFVQGSSQSHILAVSQGNSNVYTGVFKNDSLDAYCDWLRGNLQNIIQSLNLMSEDCGTWNPMSFQTGLTAGPFLYGFVPKDKSWMTDISSNLQGPIKSLIESLEKLEKALQTSSSAAATAGGVFTGLLGTGGLGAGAAYATNAFGFQNLITSFISSFLK
ncbi:putative RIBOSOME BINDING PROTEIN-1 [Babesia divergens]|uniref:RIBOSOME BINDING PROTEIN-1 n=1 Tax=Babesia divergens TaxID=32595 RepID=A0AAD9G8G3_BABDI|nr:putative RIBOSOME BINDING PROTEIN-1 [Babesia divergens]